MDDPLPGRGESGAEPVTPEIYISKTQARLFVAWFLIIFVLAIIGSANAVSRWAS